jgi:hypothetical protein
VFRQFRPSGRDLAGWKPPVGGAFAFFHCDGRVPAAALTACPMAFALLVAVVARAYCFTSPVRQLDHSETFGALSTGTVGWDGAENGRAAAGETFGAAGLGAGGETG